MTDRTALQDRIETLEEENRQLRALLVPAIEFPHEWGLSPSQRRMLATIWGGVPVSYERIEVALDGFSDEPCSGARRDAMVKRLRRKLPSGYAIKSIYQTGLVLQKPEAA